MYKIYDTAAIKYNNMDTGNSIVSMFIVKVCSCYSTTICIPTSSLDVFDPKGSSPCDMYGVCYVGRHCVLRLDVYMHMTIPIVKTLNFM